MLDNIRDIHEDINKSIDNTFTAREKQILRSYFFIKERIKDLLMCNLNQ